MHSSRLLTALGIGSTDILQTATVALTHLNLVYRTSHLQVHNIASVVRDCMRAPMSDIPRWKYIGIATATNVHRFLSSRQ
jgi:hypothetical protein